MEKQINWVGSSESVPYHHVLADSSLLACDIIPACPSVFGLHGNLFSVILVNEKIILRLTLISEFFFGIFDLTLI